ncbi:Crp/Fnr family transcriptional regulator [Pleurocapsales cyanobacterium LEGE 10410]|nr:Crp/Fnr family transcriptional regulator [Pleurocapsales cyanobacterium LEGE 10410]
MSQAFAKTIASIFPFWAELDAKAQTDLLTQGQYLKLSAGQFICLEGELCNSLPLVISGNVRIYKIGESAREITLYHLDRGDSCIMTASCILSQKIFPAFAVTETEVEAFAVPAASLREWVKHNHVWQEYIFGLLSLRLANVIEIVEEVAFGRLDCRIASYLIDNSDRSLRTIAITHEAIAHD